MKRRREGQNGRANAHRGARAREGTVKQQFASVIRICRPDGIGVNRRDQLCVGSLILSLAHRDLEAHNNHQTSQVEFMSVDCRRFAQRHHCPIREQVSRCQVCFYLDTEARFVS